MSKKVVEFVGLDTGDGDCLCFEVDEETYRRIEGDRSWRLECEYRDEEGLKDLSWQIYPMFGATDSVPGKRYRVKVEVEEITDGESSSPVPE